MLFDGIQTLLGEAGEAACNCLCLIDIAEEYRAEHPEEYKSSHIDIVEAMRKGIEHGHILYNWEDQNDNSNYTVKYPALFLNLLTGKKWSYAFGPVNYKPKKNEYVMECYERKTTTGSRTHFQRRNFKPIVKSITVAQGECTGTRVCEVLN